MEVISRGEVTFTELPVADARIAVRAPGMHVAWRTVEALPALGVDEEEVSPEQASWQEAIADNDLSQYAAVEAQPLAFEAAPGPALMMIDSPDEYVEMRTTPPSPEEGVLLMVETGGVVQWYLPVNAPPAMAALGIDEAAAPELRFLVPQSTLSRGAVIAGFGEGIGGAVVRFFRFPLVKELIGKGIAKVVEWIAENVEKKHKKEGFRWFDAAAGYPYLTQAELAGLAGKRVLLLTHGIFSSLEGAFKGISDPQSAIMQHLRARYGRNIIGWDHWTVAKTPLENAEELLSALPAGVQPDIVCHSRGALVTRAMLEHPSLQALRASKFPSLTKTIFVAGANQGSQLASVSNINRLLNIYAAIGSIPVLGSAGVALKVVVGVLKVLAHGVTMIPSIEALSPDASKNPFLAALNQQLMTPVGEIVVVHANYDPSSGPLAGFLDLNVDFVFNQANDLVVPYTGAEVFDKWQQVGTNFRFGTAAQTQSIVMHTNFFFQPGVHQLLQAEL